jgi:lysyl-tRNA synthetase class 2
MLQNLRAFFAERRVLEVETPLLSAAAITDPNLHSLPSACCGRQLFLHTSPEFFMKRLLAAQHRDVYQVCKVFRDDEQGRLHNPEFSMLEWYRQGFDHFQLMDEIQQLLQNLWQALTGTEAPVTRRLTYQQAFMDALAIDPLVASCEQLQNCARQHRLEIPIGMDLLDRDMWLDWLLTQRVFPTFDKRAFTYLYDYPASQAALARLSPEDPRVAERFEVFYGELELANGFHELADAALQRQRFEQENSRRQRQGKPAMPLDQHLLQALQAGMPDCAGVALGLDRLLMVLLGKHRIDDVLSFSFDRV